MTLDDVVCLKEEGARPQVADERNYVPPGSPSELYQIIIMVKIIIVIVIVLSQDHNLPRRIKKNLNKQLACCE